MVFKSFISAACILVLTAFTANASVIYTYTGNNFTNAADPYTTDMNITLKFESASPLPVTGAMTNVSAEILSYTMFDGRKTLTESDSPLDIYLNIDTATGLPSEWSIHSTNEFGKSLGDIVNRMRTIYNSFSGGPDSAEELECAFIPSNIGECMGFIFVAGADIHNLPGSPGTWSVVPIPATAWLFTSGLIGLIGLTRRKKAQRLNVNQTWLLRKLFLYTPTTYRIHRKRLSLSNI